MVAQQNQYVNSDFISFHLSIFILLLVLFGGSGNLYGPLIGAVLLTLIDALLARWPSVQHFRLWGPAAFSLYLMPNGVAGLIKQLFGGRGHAEPVRSKSKSVVAAKSERASEPQHPLLDIDTVSKHFGGVRPAQDVSFRLQRGHVHALIGPNGAGKSTMINMITGVSTPTAGRITFVGQDICGRKVMQSAVWGSAHFPEPKAFRGSLSAGERAARAALPDEKRLLGVAPRVAILRKRGGRAHGPGMGDP